MKNYFKIVKAKQNYIFIALGLIIAFFAVKVYFREAAVSKIIEKINNSTAWLSNVTAQALERGLSLEEMLRENALFLIDTNPDYAGKWWNF